MHLNAYGQIAHNCLEAIPAHFAHVKLDAFVVMPNHIHVIIVISDTPNANGGANDKPAYGNNVVGAQHAAPLPTTAIDTHSVPSHPRVTPGSLGAIVRSYKSAVTRKINQCRHTPGLSVWQRNFYEHIIRNKNELNAIRAYMHNNPANWHNDDNYSVHIYR